MQLALNVLLFLSGCVVTSFVVQKPNKSRATLDHFLSNLRYVLDAFKSVGNDGSSERVLEIAKIEAPAPGTAGLMTKDDVEQLPEDCWQREAYEHVKSILLATEPSAKRFPCIYATAGYKSNEHRYIFMHSEDVNEPRNIRLLAEAMRAYFPLSHELGNNTSLVIVFPISEESNGVEDYQQKFWDLLRGLRTRDMKDWPEEFPQDTQHPKWTFCFDGVPWFPAVLTPAHVKRHSRYAPNFTIGMQPKWVFDHLFRTPERRRAAVESVRKLMKPYDDIEISPDLSAYGTEGTTESHQYYLLDDNVTASCPYQDLDR